jgi:hypothetical protein
MDQHRSRITPEDNLLIFYAGHGVYDESSNTGYWLPSDAQRTSTARWLRNSTIIDYIKIINSKHTLLISDACFAGSIFRARGINQDDDVFRKLYDLPSRKAMTSGYLSEIPDESPFVKYLVQRLEDNTNLYLTSEQLFSSLRMAVINNSAVVPQYGEIHNVGDEGGDFLFLLKQQF